MNTSKLRRKRVLVPALAAVAALAVGGTVWTATADDHVSGDERTRVAAAATKAAGGGRAVDVEVGDDRGEAYEVEVRMGDGTEVDVALDEDLRVVRQETDDRDDVDARDDRDDDPDADDRRLGAAERDAAENAALAAVGGGTLLEVEASDDRGAAYEAVVVDGDDTVWEVVLDADLALVSKAVDD